MGCCKLDNRGSLKFFRGMQLNRHPRGFAFFSGGLQVFLGGCDLHRNCGMVVILLSFLYNNNNFTLKLHQGKRSHHDEGWFFIARFEVGSVPGISVALKASQKVSKSITSMMQGHYQSLIIVIDSPIYK